MTGVQTCALPICVLRDLAIGDIKAKTDLSPVVKELANANETIRQQAEQLASLNKRLEALELFDEKPRRGRPPANFQEAA